MPRLFAVLISFMMMFSTVVCAKDTYFIGFLGNTNNANSVAMFNAVKLAADDFNLTNTSYSVNTEFFNETDPAVIDAIKNKGNLLGVVAAFNASHKSLIENVQEIPLISVVSEFAGLNMPARQNLFRVAASEEQLAADTCRFLISVSLKAKLAIVYSTESDEYVKMAQSFKYTAERNRAWSEYFKDVDPDRRDFTAVLQRLRDLKVHNIYFAGGPAQAAALARQSSELNVGADFSSTHLICSSSFIKSAKAGSQGAVFASMAPSSLYGFKKFRPILKKYTGAYKGDDMHVPYAYDAARLLINSLVNGKTDKNDIVNFLRGSTYDGATGEIAFKGDGDRANPPVYFYIIRGKEFLQRNLSGSEALEFSKAK